MTTRTRDIAPLVKGKRSTNISKTKSLVQTHNAIIPTASNKNTIPSYLKSEPASSSYSNIHQKQTLNHKTSFDKPPSLDNVHSKNAASSSDPNIHSKQTLARRRSLDYKAALSSSPDNTRGKKLVASSSTVPPNIQNTDTLARRRLSLDHRPLLSSSLDNTRGKKPPSSSSDPNIHSKQSLAQRRLSFDHRPPPHSIPDNNPRGEKLVPRNDHNSQNKQTPTQRRSFDHKPPLSSPLLKARTISPNPRERIVKPSLSFSSKTSTSQEPLMNKLSKSHYTSTKDVIGKKHSPGLYAGAVKQDSPAGLTSKTFITSNLADIVEHINPQGEELEQEEHQDSPAGAVKQDSPGKKHSPGLYAGAVKQDSPAGLTSKTFITSYLTDIVEHINPQGEELEQKEHQDSPAGAVKQDSPGKKHSPGLYAGVVKQDSPAGLTSKTFITSNLADIVEHINPQSEELEQEEHQEAVNVESNLVIDEDHEELSETVNIDEYLMAAESSLYVVENQEVVKMEVQEEKLLVEETKNEPSKLDLEETEKQESVTRAVSENQEKKEEVQESEVLAKALENCQQEKEEEKENEEKEMDVNIQEDKEESEGRNKEKEGNKIRTMAFAKPCLHLVQGNKKESVVSNDVIEETANKLREQRKNRVRALASAFETVISLQDSR